MSEVLLIATSNPGKYREIVDVLRDLPLDFRHLGDYGRLPDVVEDAATFMGNAEKKALHYAAMASVTTLADDSGLEVDCLGGQPGVHSARFAGPEKNDMANNRRLVEMVRHFPLHDRKARFRCAIAVAREGRIISRAEGQIEGLIIEQPRGTNGFGYDPHFLIPELHRTSAELDPAQKNHISHRGRALAATRHDLSEFLHC